MTRFILVRHGETTWNIEGRYQGQEDTPLSPRGIEQGKKLAKALEHVPIDACWASPLKRAYETCGYCAAYHNLPVHTDPRLTEIHHGDWEGVLAEEIAAAYPKEFAAWKHMPATVQMPGEGGENLEAVAERSFAFFEEMAAGQDGKTLLVAAHDAVNKVVICRILGMDLNKFWQVKQDNTCINVLEYDGKNWRLVLMNNTNHMGFLFSGIEQKGL